SESLKDLAKFRIENLNERKESLKNYSQIKSKNRKFLSDVLPTNEKEQDYINDNISQTTLNSESNLKKKFKKKNKSKCHQNRKLKKKKINLEHDQTINSKIIPFLILIKETRIALMLFVVSLVFISCYFPSILATRSLLPNDNLLIVYLYFTNSAINPIIYSFMNRSFRSDLIKLLRIKSNPIFSLTKFSTYSEYSRSQNVYELKNII
ncbi:unnamed protein product, partial [Brachionus calyciflorus]